MSRVIYKYEVQGGWNHLSVPGKPNVVHVDEQHGAVWAWVEHDVPGPDVIPAASFHDTTILVAGTGHSFDIAGMRHVNTFKVDGGTYIFHAYQKEPEDG